MINLPNKFNVDNFTHYGDTKDVVSCIKWGNLEVAKGHSRSSVVLLFDAAHTTSYSLLAEIIRLS